MIAESSIAGVDELPQRVRAVLIPVPREKVIVDEINDHACKAPALRGDQGFQSSGDRMLVGEAVDGAVPDDALNDPQWQLLRQRLRSPCHEVAKQISDPGQGIIFGKQQVGEVVQGSASIGEPEAESRNAGFPTSG